MNYQHLNINKGNMIAQYLDLTNHRPRKCLKYQTPNEGLNEGNKKIVV